MLKHFKTFFSPTIITYSYSLPKEIIITKISEVFQKKVTLSGSNDIRGKFLSNDIFSIDVVLLWFTWGAGYGSTLTGQIIESQKGLTEIMTKAKPSLLLYFLFFVSIVLGFGYFYKFIEAGSTGFLFWSFAMLIGGPALSIGFSNVAIASVRERYKMYIDKELKN